MYTDEQELSPTDKILVYSGMYILCSEFSTLTNIEKTEADQNDSLATTFFTLLLQSLATFSMLTPPSIQTIEAFLSAVRTPRSGDILN